MALNFGRTLLVVSLAIVAVQKGASAQQRAQQPAKQATTDTISPRADRGRITGDSTAGAWLIMVSDFQCPYCKDWHDATFAGIMRDYVSTGRVRVAFYNFPLAMHQNAMPAAEAAMCAGVQNKFWPLHESLFATQGKWSTLNNPTAFFDSLAGAAGVNMRLYRACIGKHMAQPLIEADRERARQRGAKSTPTFFIVKQGANTSQVLEGSDAKIRESLDAVLGVIPAAKKPN